MHSEADKILKALLAYAVSKRKQGVYDFTEIIDGFCREMLASEESEGKNTIRKRFREMVKEYVAQDPKYQSRLDIYE